MAPERRARLRNCIQMIQNLRIDMIHDRYFRALVVQILTLTSEEIIERLIVIEDALREKEQES